NEPTPRVSRALSCRTMSRRLVAALALDDALAKARSENKFVLVFLRANCASCNRNADAFVESAETHEAIVRSYGSFIRARVDGDRNLLAQKAEAVAAFLAGSVTSQPLSAV